MKMLRPAQSGRQWAVGAALLAALALPAIAAPVPVVELSGRSAAAPSGAVTAGAAGVSELFVQVQALQEEIRELHGQLEEQNHQIQLLQQQQKDNYLDLDGRLSAIVTGGAATADRATAPLTPPVPADRTLAPAAPLGNSPAPVAAPGGAAAPPVAAPATKPGEQAAYEAAYEQLKQGKMDDAQADFQTFVTTYPGSSYVPNALYWMGEIALVKNDAQGALTQFNRVVDNYPAHAKAADAHYKLGTLYMQLNDKARARAHLEKAILAGGNVGTLAQRYLDTHF
ncbi:MAG: tol-pal system protein YbgF [Porticoccaceae bacterium]